MECLPTWRNTTSGNNVRFPKDGVPITVGYPVDLDSVARPAIEAWQNKLSQWGLDLQLTPAPGVGCAVTDAHCVAIETQTCADSPASCGCRNSNAGADGIYFTRSMLYLKPGNDSWPAEARTWVIAHEMGHLLGLDEADGCGAPTSVMGNSSMCGVVGTNATTPTDSDALPLAKTVYSDGPKKTCS